MPLSPKWYTWLCGLFASLGSVLFGYDLGIIASVLPSSNFRETTGEPTPGQEGLIVGLLLLGAFTSNIYVGTMAGTFLQWRKLAMLTDLNFVVQTPSDGASP